MGRHLDEDDVLALHDTSDNRIAHAIALAVAVEPYQSPFNCLVCILFVLLSICTETRPNDANNQYS